MRFFDNCFGTGKRTGFTVAELLVSVAILAVISISVVRDISLVRQQEELLSSARMVQAALRDIQSDAFTAASVRSCLVSGADVVCENSNALCGASLCNRNINPSEYGIVFQTSTSTFYTFADVYNLDFNADSQGRESLSVFRFPQTSRGVAPRVQVVTLRADGTSISRAHITFNRQSGTMMINPCLTAPCSPAEANELVITLRHTETRKQKIIRVQRLTGRITIE